MGVGGGVGGGEGVKAAVKSIKAGIALVMRI